MGQKPVEERWKRRVAGVLAPLAMAAVTVIAVPAGPAAAVPPGGYAFVANLGSDTVSVIDTIGVGTYPTGVATAVVRAPAPTCAKAMATITGTDGSDVITGTPGDDVIFALGGNDVIDGAGGNDLVCGGTGHDLLRGDTGDDRIEGGNGNDVLLGGDGDDALFGEAGSDVLLGGVGDNTNDGGAGVNVCANPEGRGGGRVNHISATVWNAGVNRPRAGTDPVDENLGGDGVSEASVTRPVPCPGDPLGCGPSHRRNV
ncbi:hypothetical protein V2J94_09250 [Streptomyces sp. DSM 41524]|uniref:Calcium-binding protein n=1 Tax=Streptomyces asiaticus subsp. ignotus TaxID=3098222 RepID=A0ABU7PSR3_9ACTN|nr:hypothetical protein [Streptomyces sp. DSM 41524]